MLKKLIFVILLPLLFTFSSALSQQVPYCPKTLMMRDCLKCHTVPSFKIKEAFPDEVNVYPIENMRVIDEKGYFSVAELSSNNFKKFFDYLSYKKINYAVIEIHSIGGSLFEALRIINLMSFWEKEGNIIETKVNGVALSGGFIVFIGGTKGYRNMSKFANLMWHEITTFEMFAIKISTPSDKEEEARVLRQLQDYINSWIATRGNLGKTQIDEKIRKKEWWMNGEEAIKYGFADRLF